MSQITYSFLSKEHNTTNKKKKNDLLTKHLVSLKLLNPIN